MASDITLAKKNTLIHPAFLLANLLNFLILTGNGLYILYPLHLQDMGKTETQMGYIMGIFSLSALLSRVLASPHIDRRGRLFFVRWGIVILSFTSLLYCLPFKSDAFLMVVRMLHGISHGLYFTAIFTWVADYSPPGRMAEYIGIFGISGLLTISSGPFVGEWVLKSFHHNYLFLFITGFLLALTGLLLSFQLRDIHQNEETIKSHEKPAIGEERENPLKSLSQKTCGTLTNSGGFFSLLLSPPVLSVAIISMVFGFATGSVFTFTAPFLRSIGIFKTTAVFSAYAFSSVLSRLFLGRLSDQLGRNTLIIPGLVINALCQSFIFMINSEKELYILGFFLGFSHGMTYPSLNALMMDRIPSHNRGMGTGIFNASVDIGFIIGSPLLGFSAYLMGFSAMFALSGIAMGLGLLSFVVMDFLLYSGKKTPLRKHL